MNIFKCKRHFKFILKYLNLGNKFQQNVLILNLIFRIILCFITEFFYGFLKIKAILFKPIILPCKYEYIQMQIYFILNV
jgi:hypothetical protein